jgi:AraC-like DNA-binding protein
MRVLSMLTPILHDRARCALLPADTLLARASAREFVGTVHRGWADVAIIEPTLVSGDALVPVSLGHAHLGAVLYILLTPAHATAAIEFHRKLDVDIAIFGCNDDPASLAIVLARRSRRQKGSILLELLKPQISRLPKIVQDGINALNERCTTINSVSTLSSYVGIARSTLARLLREAGICTPANLVVGLNLVRNFDILADPTISQRSAAALMGIGSIRSMNRHCVALVGLTPKQIRRGLQLETFAERVATALTAAGRCCER